MRTLFLLAILLVPVQVCADWLKVPVTNKCKPRISWCADLPPEIRDYSALIPTDKEGNPLTTDIVIFVSPKIDTSRIVLKPGSVPIDKATADTEIAARDPKVGSGTLEKQP